MKKNHEINQFGPGTNRLSEACGFELQKRRDKRRRRGQKRDLGFCRAERNAVGDEIRLAHPQHHRREQAVGYGKIEALSDRALLEFQWNNLF